MPDLYTAKTDADKPINSVSPTKPETSISEKKLKIINELPVSTNPFSAFALNPSGVNFENQKNDETVLLLLRQHWGVNTAWILAGILFFFLPWLFKYFPGYYLLPEKYQLAVFIGWYLLLAAFVFEKFLSWFFNVGIVTDRRVVDVDFFGLLYKEISDAELDKIEDVTLKQVGAIRTVFDFGDINIQTAGEKANIEFNDVPHPRRVVKLLEDLR
ncbi:MAG: hypothetical protein BWY24_00295 [Microgenomates group bacterium ADurb.Bin219]|nr:MAG: hypothetical protein BWY24_00295 [Microgenomates group bacterium ADurb.Bin219]HNP89393.1 PH domain-containing protein [Candidatus Woesebacteria bacterium]